MRILAAASLALAALAAAAQDAPTPQPADEPAETEQAPTAADAAEPTPFTPPPGFKTKKRGELVLYCKKDSTVGTRFKTEKCYDEEQMREYLLALEIQKRDLDRIRNTCGSAEACTAH